MVAFGTSGLRGLAVDLLAGPGYAHVCAFARHMLAGGSLAPGAKVLVGRDLRASSPELARQTIAALAQSGLTPVYCGVIPTPALALQALKLGAGAVMVTGSHIPADRNGLKFYRPDGEIAKADERAIAALARENAGSAAPSELPRLPPPDDEAVAAYLARYRTAFPQPVLQGKRVGVYRHSSVAADILVDLAGALGSEVVRLGESDGFVAVDTEAIDARTADRLKAWSRDHRLDAIISTDGDGDRPLLADETGRIVRGDALGLISARFLKADAVVTPVTSNPGIVGGDGFRLFRTKVGSPFVLEGMAAATAAGHRAIIGFEANGGLLIGSPIALPTAELEPLPTRDSVLPILCALTSAFGAGLELSALVAGLELPACASGRLENFSRDDSERLMTWLSEDEENVRTFLGGLGDLSGMDDTDGLQMTLSDGGSLHLRPSGNAPEMRCYASAQSEERTSALLAAGLERIRRFAQVPGLKTG
ncbi:phosphomannomutase [Pseudaminobacter sp. 19-2017]|uniref:Phosphomannomutase n=1 Tax=Pseudaminobacter soli (ex Zhang et al. 2022) TaxID=2831468 RepID=A0A942DYK5_9HYPH|nr:phosphomannomutase [Pseudaminobacter soli]MBS3649507.1 phosphomannomutase [Pseudaminobacter soli]